MASPGIPPEILQDKILQLKSKIGDTIATHPIFANDLYLLMWLRSTNLNVEQSEKKIRVSAKWRDEFNKTGRHVDHSEVANRYGFQQCKSRDGRGVLVASTAKMDLVRLFSEISEERQERFVLNTLLDMELDMVEANKRNFDGNLSVNSARGILVLAEVGSVPFRAVATPRIAVFYYGLCRRISVYFPGAIQTLLWINAPSALGLALRACGKFLSGPFFTTESVSGQRDIQDKVYSIVNPEELEGGF